MKKVERMMKTKSEIPMKRTPGETVMQKMKAETIVKKKKITKMKTKNAVTNVLAETESETKTVLTCGLALNMAGNGYPNCG